MSHKHKKEYINREISWLSFNERVLQEAQDSRVPLISRMRYLGIFSNNLDEFFKVRVATLHRAKGFRKGLDQEDFDPTETLTQIHDKVVELQEKFDSTFDDLKKDLKKKNIHFINETELLPEQKDFCEAYFEKSIRPALVPLMLSSKTPFPALNDNAIYLVIELGYKTKKTHEAYALIEIPTALERFIELPSIGNKKMVIFIDDVIRFRLRKVFGIFDYDYAQAYTIKITRDAELDLDDDISKSLVEKMSRSVSQRKKGDYVRLNYDSNMSQALLDFILRKTRIKDKENIIPGGRYHNNKDLMNFPDFGKKELVFSQWPATPHPALENQRSIIEAIRSRDILLHYPYQSFGNIVDLMREAAIDPNVRTIRISIYRVAHHSQIVNALINAAKNGKHVIVVVELQARFDEENNIKLTRSLQEAGARVIPGVPGLKVHGKLILISRKENNRTNRYVHIGSGNFNEKTSSIYSDISLLTANKEIAVEVRKLFEFFESNYTRHVYRHLAISPFNARRKFTDLINQEIENAELGKPSWITIKLNNLVDTQMIKKLYEASEAGVKIRLIIRGICSLVPGIKDLSENIQVISIVGRYLEHGRIIAFCNNDAPLYYLTSADWMMRNLDHRVEVSVPVYDPHLQKELADYLAMQLDPNAKARIVDKSLSNRYLKPRKGMKVIDTQLAAYNYFKKLKY